MSSERDPIESAAKGATKGVLDWTADKIKELVVRFNNRELAFIKDRETIDIAKEQRNNPEWKFFIEHIKDSELHILFQMGLTLRKLENEDKDEASLRTKILNKYDKKGLHIAQVVQNGIFSNYIGNILKRTPTSQRLRLEIENLFENIEKTVIFIKIDDDEKKKVLEVVSKITAHSPETFIISSRGNAMEKCEKIMKKVMLKIANYEVELYLSKDRRNYFLIQVNST